MFKIFTLSEDDVENSNDQMENDESNESSISLTSGISQWILLDDEEEDVVEEVIFLQTRSKAYQTPFDTTTTLGSNKKSPLANKINSNASKSLQTKYKLEYDLVEDMKKIRENISLCELLKLNQQKHKLLQSLGGLSIEIKSPIQDILAKESQFIIIHLKKNCQYNLNWRKI